jgi:hypothetical protein
MWMWERPSNIVQPMVRRNQQIEVWFKLKSRGKLSHCSVVRFPAILIRVRLNWVVWEFDNPREINLIFPVACWCIPNGQLTAPRNRYLFLFILLISNRPLFTNSIPLLSLPHTSVFDIPIHNKWPVLNKLPASRPVAKPLANNSHPRPRENLPQRTDLTTFD